MVQHHGWPFLSQVFTVVGRVRPQVGGLLQRRGEAFFNRYLRGQNVPKLPSLRLEVRETREHIVGVRDENEWPLARTQWQSLHLGLDGTLNRIPGSAGEVTFSLKRNTAAFTYVFDEDTELSGPMNPKFWMSCTGTDDPSLFVGIEKVAR